MGQIIITSDTILRDTLRRIHIKAPSVLRLSLRSRLTKHIRTHTREKPYQCNQCDKAFPEMQNLTKHKNTHWVKPCQCSHCKKSFAQNSNLLIHLKTHTVEKSYHYNI